MATYAPPPHYGEITFFELIPLAFRFIGLAINLVIKAFLYPFSTTHFTLKRVLWRTFVQTICPNSTIRQMQWVSPNTGSLYETYMKSLPNKPPIVHETIGADGGSLHWVGPKTNSKVMVFIHGGGFVLPAVDGHFYMIDWWRKEAKMRYGIDFSVAVLEYSLVNFKPWPAQLTQVAAALSHLLKQGYDPANITFVGDSVGGHVAVFLLAHLLHPHPSADPIKLSKPLGGVAALSPWLAYSTDTPSFKRHAANDVMPLPALVAWSSLFQKSRTRRDDGYYFEPATAPPEWWTGLDKVANNVLLSAGGAEGMLDDIVVTEKKMEMGAGRDAKVELYVQDNACHNEALVEFACGDQPGPSANRVLSWIAEVYA
ncbi:unnamed protein product [Somion occarium]|uniref:Alpha/beta hydrolase fold-3 domain-containing protein n=1 Tax=Somion occarium TaxID=3059160 RepID=A0ABP1D0W8_9APHY